MGYVTYPYGLCNLSLWVMLPTIIVPLKPHSIKLQGCINYISVNLEKLAAIVREK